MPCFSTLEEYEDQRIKDELSYVSHKLCRILTLYFFGPDDKLRDEMKNNLAWYERHLKEDIEYCQEQVTGSKKRHEVVMKNENERKGAARYHGTEEKYIEWVNNMIKDYQDRLDTKKCFLEKLKDIKGK